MLLSLFNMNRSNIVFRFHYYRARNEYEPKIVLYFSIQRIDPSYLVRSYYTLYRVEPVSNDLNVERFCDSLDHMSVSFL